MYYGLPVRVLFMWHIQIFVLHGTSGYVFTMHKSMSFCVEPIYLRFTWNKEICFSRITRKRSLNTTPAVVLSCVAPVDFFLRWYKQIYFLHGINRRGCYVAPACELFCEAPVDMRSTWYQMCLSRCAIRFLLYVEPADMPFTAHDLLYFYKSPAAMLFMWHQ